MSRDTLCTYLNDHLAGSVGAVEMAERAIRENDGTPFAESLARVVHDIREDQLVLKNLIERLGGGTNPLKTAGAWLAEKAGRIKLGGTDDPRELSRLEVLETLTMGIHGKGALWRALRLVSDRHDAVARLDLDQLQRRAAAQHDAVEVMRLEAARAAL